MAIRRRGPDHVATSQCGVPSISYALVSCGKLFAANAHGWASPNAAASSTTLCQAAKTLAAVGGLCPVQANAEGCTRDSDVTDFQTSWRLPTDGKQTKDNPVTLRQLLGMTAGANVHGYPG